MKRLLWLSLLFASPLHGAIAYVAASHTVCPQATASAGVACTLTAASTLGNTVVVSIALKTPRVVTNMAGSAAAAFFMQVTPALPNGANNAAVLEICFNCPALTTVTPTLNSTSIYELEVDEYSGVAAIGSWASKTATSAGPNVALTTIDSNNWVVAVTSSIGSDGIPTAGTGCGTTTGTLRGAGRTANASTGAAIGVCDNTVSSPGSVSLTDTITSSAWSAVAAELRSASTAAACTSPCPGLVQYAQWGSNDGTPVTGTSIFYNLPWPTLAGNTLIAFITAGGGTVGVVNNISSLTINGNSFTSAVTCNDGQSNPTKENAIFYLSNTSAGWQNLTLNLAGVAGADDVQIAIGEFYNIKTSASPIDGTPTCATIQAPPGVQPGSVTTTVNGDLVFVAGANDNLFSGAQYVASFDPAVAANTGSNSLTMLGDTRRFGPFAFFINQQTLGAINPAMYIDQGTKDNWNVAAAAFKSDTTGTAPSGMRIVREIVEIPSTTTYRIDLPCSGNLKVATQPNITSAGHLTSIVDANQNTYSILGNGTLTGTIAYAKNYTCANPNYNQATVTSNSVASPGPIHFYDIIGANTNPLDTSITTSTVGATASSGLVDSGAQTAHFSTSSVSCPNSANSNTVLNFTPSTSSGIAFVVEQNGQGPECGTITTNGTLDSAWFAGEDDASFGPLESSSGFGHVTYSSTSPVTWTFEWANCLADTPNTGCASGTGPGNTGSSYDMILAAFKAPAVAATPAPKLLMMNVGQ